MNSLFVTIGILTLLATAGIPSAAAFHEGIVSTAPVPTYTYPSTFYPTYRYPVYGYSSSRTSVYRRRSRSVFGPLPSRVCSTDPWLMPGSGLAGENIPLRMCMW